MEKLTNHAETFTLVRKIPRISQDSGVHAFRANLEIRAAMIYPPCWENSGKGTA